MTRPRLAAIDLDGTLLRSDGTLSDRSRAALVAAREADIEIVLATARSPRSVRLIAADAGLTGIAICANGAIVYDLDTDTIVRHTPLASETAHRLSPGSAPGFPASCSAGSTSCGSGASRLTRSCDRPSGRDPKMPIRPATRWRGLPR